MSHSGNSVLSDIALVLLVEYGPKSAARFQKVMNVKETKVEVRNMAVGMLEGGMTQKEVVMELDVLDRTVRSWWK